VDGLGEGLFGALGLDEKFGNGDAEEGPAEIGEKLRAGIHPKTAVGEGEPPGEDVALLFLARVFDGSSGLEQGELGVIHAGMILGTLAEDAPEKEGEGDPGGSIDPTGPAPVAEAGDDGDGEPRSHGPADAAAEGDDAAGEAAFRPLGPPGEEPAADGVGTGLGETAADPGEEEGDGPGGEAGEDGEERPEDDVDGHQRACPEAHGEVAGGQLADGVGGEEGAFDPAIHQGIEGDVGFEGIGIHDRRHADAVEIHEEGGRGGGGEDPMADGGGAGGHESGRTPS